MEIRVSVYGSKKPLVISVADSRSVGASEIADKIMEFADGNVVGNDVNTIVGLMMKMMAGVSMCERGGGLGYNTGFARSNYTGFKIDYDEGGKLTARTIWSGLCIDCIPKFRD
jgi:hypothetical protein